MTVGTQLGNEKFIHHYASIYEQLSLSSFAIEFLQ